MMKKPTRNKRKEREITREFLFNYERNLKEILSQIGVTYKDLKQAPYIAPTYPDIIREKSYRKKRKTREKKLDKLSREAIKEMKQDFEDLQKIKRSQES
jgi:hypothetical protein